MLSPNNLYVRSVTLKRPFPREGYPYDLPVVQRFEALWARSPVVCIVGENGTGKSTLLEALAVHLGFNAEGGSRNFRFATAQTHSSLHECVVTAKGPMRPRDNFFLRSESFYNVATQIDAMDEIAATAPPIKRSYGGISLHEQSHGESFFSLLRHRFGGRGLYLLDEPEAALSPLRQLSALRIIHELVQDDSQFILCTHSPILMAYPGAQVLVVQPDGALLETPYERTEHFMITRQFLNAPEKMLQELFAD